MAQRPRARFDLQLLEDRTTPAVGFGPTGVTAPEYAADRVLVGFHPGQEAAGLSSIARSQAVTATKHLGFGVYKLSLAAGVGVPAALSLLSNQAGLRYVEPDYLGHRTALPNDPMVRDGSQWGVNNYGQSGGTPGADIKATAGWAQAIGTGQTVVAVLDDGIDYTHPDLAGNMWRNPGEVAGNGVDDDANGYVDDVFGVDTGTDDGDPFPHTPDKHGTHVAGTIGAVGNNGLGVSGVAQKTRLMAVNIFTPGTGYFVSDEVEGIAYAVRMGAKVMNGSIGGFYGLLQAELDAYRGARDAGVIAVVAAGNDTQDIDNGPHFPAGLSRYLDNVVTVAAVDRNDQLSTFSNWGKATADIAAPGSAIWSSVTGGGYELFNGTSMATPHVAGAVTVFWDANPDFTYREVIQALKDSARKISSLTNLVETDGTLDLDKFLSLGKLPLFATGAGEGGAPHVKVYRGNGREVASFYAFDTRFAGGVRVATGDVTGDGYADVVTAAGPGGGPHVKVFDGKTFQEVFSFYAFEETFRGGLNVAAGDVNGDGRADIIVGADAGGAPRVSVFGRLTPTGGLVRLSDFYAYDTRFSGGVRVAAGTFTAGSKVADIVTAPGRGGGPHVRRFGGASVVAWRPTVVVEAYSGDPNDTSGLWVSAGDLNGDGVADVVTGAGAGTPVVRAHDGRSLAPLYTMVNPFSGEINGLVNPASTTQVGATTLPLLGNGLIPPGSSPDSLNFQGNQVKPVSRSGYIYGVRVAVQDVNGDKKPDLILAGGPNDTPTVALIDGQSRATVGIYSAYDPAFNGGVFVGGVVL
jgi:subtilisin family serine protease